ncbi:MAG: hypothetical protein JST12_13800 [Armatimonadetes bacterium]|nr:hypothetical protein [Armatimonadota bacterium]
MEKPLTINDFEPLVGSEFYVPYFDREGNHSSLTLTEATKTGNPHPGRTEPFSLLFEGPKALALDQGTYLLHHDSLGDLTIFIVPIAESGDIRQYQSIFN